MVVLRTGDAVEEGDVGEVFARPRHPYTRALLEAVPRLPATPSSPPERPVPVDETPVLRYDDVSVVFRSHGREFHAVDGVSLDVPRSRILGLVGESGSGKTTLGRVAAGLVAPTEGRVEIDGVDLRAPSPPELRAIRRNLAFVPQDPAASLDPRMTVAESVTEPLAIHRVGDKRERGRRCAELLEAVRLPAELAGRLPMQLSGGQRQRVALARALALRPELVIADEPTSALDVSVQAEVLRLLRELHDELGFSCLFISHDLAVIYEICEDLAVLRAGEVVEAGPVETVFADPRHAYTRALLAAVPNPPPAPSIQHKPMGDA